jgi:hypothetical protein
MKSFNKIMNVFTKVVDDLDTLEDKNINKKVKLDSKINKLQTKGVELRMEAEMAAVTANKIREFYEIN